MASFAFLFPFLFCVFSFQSSVTNAICHISKCGDTGPDILYPFHTKGQRQDYDTLPSFELLCKNNVTTIQFPSYGNLVVKSISYDTKKIDLFDPKNCTHLVFMNLNLSLTPFHYFNVLKNYTYLNCSTSLPPPFVEVPCLSASSYHVYTVDPSLPVPGSCKRLKTVGIPFAYSPYLSDNSLGLGLTWDLRESQDIQSGNQTRDSHIARNAVIGFSIWVFVVAMIIISIKVGGSTRNRQDKEGKLLQKLGDF
ncbi:LEAF RUST 10 DISEASE-RESISTANCE LOCUS RECEPTOR-LIKE PROTEIN KINASE-like 1.2 [Abrus precatorius]|uniref:RING-type E3 ubiquitin transferase n=1 Tax=Abrus precatorius TaxID=3816 RepID=A0A8B8M647_ABRPR|nr:LEAF RUST 10 DISEASE-RESISTANCE LOCUS RECEPTOR-LIKE PROTEIN KINASE-like 1.2 [Abrus precatorius]